MSRLNRIAILAALALLVGAAGTVLATRSPQAPAAPGLLAASHEAEGDTEDGDVGRAAHARDRLEEAEIEVGDDFDAFVERYGVGGAVRLYAWAHELPDYDVDDLAAMRDGADGEPPMGWGKLARHLGVSPGIGSVMGNGNAPDSPPGLENRPDKPADD
jgi:hypothetical protein